MLPLLQILTLSCLLPHHGNEGLHELYIQAINTRDLALLEHYFGEDYIYHSPFGDMNEAQFRQTLNVMLTAFPDFNLVVEDTFSSKDRVVTRFRMRGTHLGDFLGIPPTGRSIDLPGIIITRVSKHRAVEEWEEFDRLKLMQQLGVLPAQ